ncbi:MAG: VOC family protein [Chloroflexota bacterium]|jgi:methylmalonyl-CoA/ethylmalonyl-CoA epimerase|nr:VOC family protein [Chloroflexota bacterium]
MPPVQVAGIDHIGLLVRDIDATLPWFTERLGFRLISDEITMASGGARLVYLDAGNVILQLLSPTSDSGPIATALAANGDGLHHICLSVDDIHGAVEGLAPGGDVPVVRGGRDRLTCFLPDRPGGLIIELTETEPSQG